MRKDFLKPWHDTPVISERIVSAISRLGTVLRSSAWEYGTTQGLNPAQLEILNILGARKDAVRLSWLATQLGVTAASASDSIGALIAKGMVEKRRAADDGRAVAIRLTHSGKLLTAKLDEVMGFAVKAVDKLPENTQQALFQSLLLLIGQLQQAEQFPQSRACVSCKHFAVNVHPLDKHAPHHCRFVDAPLPKSMLRLDCGEHDATIATTAAQNWRSLLST
jgi:DNA-binding MarR family transcriptional regulator